MKMKVKMLSKDAVFPTYAHDGDAGMDLYAAEDVDIRHGEVAMVKTGIAIALPDGYEAQIRSRSGLAAKQGLFVLNSPGTIDSGYRGEICVLLANFCHTADRFDYKGDSIAYGPADYHVKKGDRIAQMVIAKYERADREEVAELDETDRGEGGFGSTGV